MTTSNSSRSAPERHRLGALAGVGLMAGPSRQAANDSSSSQWVTTK